MSFVGRSKKIIKRILKTFGLIICLIIAFVLCVALIPPIKGEPKPDIIYNSVIKDNCKFETPVTEIAMLGAHDAFSNDISYASESNINEDGIHNNKVVNIFAKGFVIKLAKAQTANAMEMLNKGVRYLDVRITLIDGVYYTCHGLLSNTLDSYVDDVVSFLNDNPGEFVIFDIQHFFTENGCNTDLPDSDFINLFSYLEELGLMDKLNYEDNIENPSLITYGDVTNNGTKGGVVMLAKTRVNNKVFYRDGDGSYDGSMPESIRSYWHNRNSKEEMLAGIEKEYNYIKDNKEEMHKAFRVNQAQMTGFISNASAISRTIMKGSLLGLANSFNKELVSDKDRFIGYLDEMPIVMVDYVTTNKGNFNKLANEYIAEYNRNK